MDNRASSQIVAKYVAGALASVAGAWAAYFTLLLLLYKGDRPDLTIIVALPAEAIPSGIITVLLFVNINRKAPKVSYLFVLGILLIALAASAVTIHALADTP